MAPQKIYALQRTFQRISDRQSVGYIYDWPLCLPMIAIYMTRGCGRDHSRGRVAAVDLSVYLSVCLIVGKVLKCASFPADDGQPPTKVPLYWF